MLNFKENPWVQMRIRNHCGSLADALKTEQSIPRTVHSLLAELNDDLKDWVGFKITEADVSLRAVCYDDRIDCYSRLIVIEGWGPWGWLDDRPDVPDFDVDSYTAVGAVDGVDVTGRLTPITKDDVIIGWGLISDTGDQIRLYTTPGLLQSAILSCSKQNTFSIRTKGN